jgi:ABC-2 type transport system permease protein
MTRIVRAELATLVRRRVLVIAGLATTAFAVIASLATFLSAESTGAPSEGRGATLDSLSAPGGGTDAFSLGVSFVGMFVMVTFVARFAGEFSHGTLRTLLLKQPRRLLVVVGEMAALLAFMATVLVAAEIFTFLTSASLAPSQDVDTSAWYSLDGLGAAVGDYAGAITGLSAGALYGMTLGLLVRSVAVGVGIGIAWAGPVEHIAQQSWDAAGRWLPNLQLEALAAGGTEDVSTERALLFSAIYVTIAVAVGLLTLGRRDVTD